jgi:hypothetical protein
MIGREEIQRMRVQIFVVLEGVSERGGRALCPLCFHQFVPSPFCEGARSAARSKGLAPNLGMSSAMATGMDQLRF